MKAHQHSGSGFFIRHDLIVTNIHVVNQRSFDGAVSLAKLVNKPTWFTIKEVVASDPIRDLVILKVAKMGGEDPHILSIGDSDTVKMQAIAYFYHWQCSHRGTKYERGIVSQKGKIIRNHTSFLSCEGGKYT